MKFQFKHAFSCTPEELWAITESDAFEQRLAATTNSARSTATSCVGGCR
jgi:hypothetical protein